MRKKPVRPIPDPAGGTESSPHAFPTGQRLRQTEREFSATHAHRSINGVALRWGYNPHDGFRLAADPRNRAQERMQAKGIHRAIQAKLIRRGC